MTKTRMCKGCRLEKPINEFERGKQFCISCGDGARERSIRKSKKNYSTKYRINNPEKARSESQKSKTKQYYSSNPSVVLKYLLGYCKGRAKSRGYNFDLDIMFLYDLYVKQNSVCALTGIPFIFDKSNFGKRPFSPSIDRIDCDKGYTKDNVRLICTVVNFALNEFGEAVFDKICEARVHYKNEVGHGHETSK